MKKDKSILITLFENVGIDHQSDARKILNDLIEYTKDYPASYSEELQSIKISLGWDKTPFADGIKRSLELWGWKDRELLKIIREYDKN